MVLQRSVIAVAAAASLGLGVCGCGKHDSAAPVPAADTPAAYAPSAPPSAPPSPAPLPSPDDLTGVLYQLADTSVPGAQKVDLVEGATPAGGAELDKFGKALQDSGYLPLTFTASDIGWSETIPEDVSAQVRVDSDNPNLAGGFSFPMEFKPYRDGWQLSRHTADMLLALGGPHVSPTP